MIVQVSKKYAAPDGRPLVIGAASIAFAVASALAGWIGLLPASIGTTFVIAAAAVTLRVAWTCARTPSAATAALVKHGANAGLAISAITLLATLPRITAAGGLSLVTSDLAAQLWTLALLLLSAGAVRTLGWHVFAGTFLCGFLGLTGLARFVGRPVIEQVGTSDVLAVGLWVPITEEAIKLIPVALMLFVALRRTDRRPSALDITLLGAWAGAGFAVYENATFGRGTFSLTTDPVLSLLFPMATKPVALGWPIVQVGHLIHSALISLGLAVFFLYRNRVRHAWAVVVVPVASVLLEHCSQNAIVTGGVNEILARITIVLDADGRLTPVLLIAGVALVSYLESRELGRAPWSAVVRLPLHEATRRAVRLAELQTGTPQHA